MLQNHHIPFMYHRCLLGQGLKNSLTQSQKTLSSPINKLKNPFKRLDNRTSICM